MEHVFIAYCFLLFILSFLFILPYHPFISISSWNVYIGATIHFSNIRGLRLDCNIISIIKFSSGWKPYQGISSWRSYSNRKPTQSIFKPHSSLCLQLEFCCNLQIEKIYVSIWNMIWYMIHETYMIHSCIQMHNLENDTFDLVWLRIRLSKKTIFTALYTFPFIAPTTANSWTTYHLVMKRWHLTISPWHWISP